jgi:phospholipid/cholesterol/gamma-HCH transport system permease protein
LETRIDPRLDFFKKDDNSLCLKISGTWDLKDRLPSMQEIERFLNEYIPFRNLAFDSNELTSWDTSLLILISRIIDYCHHNSIQIDLSSLPQGIRKLQDMAAAIPATEDTGRDKKTSNLLSEIGTTSIKLARDLPQGLHFIGEVVLSFIRLLRGKAQFRARDLFLVIEQVGPNALPIVSLVSFLVGLILAYMGAAQLERVGVQIYIADLVAIGMIREVGALMTGIIIAGRTGASFAAELGTMQVNEEIDAFKTLGISTIDFLVLPRILALMLMIPLLTLYAGIVGTLAGMLIGITVFDISLFEYYQQTLRALDLTQFWVGIFKGSVYGMVIAISGCLRGIQCGRSAQAVGEATTSAVVTSIVYIVITASAITVVLYKLGI